MSVFHIIKDRIPAAILVEENAYEGVRLIGDTIAEDMSLITGNTPDIITSPADAPERLILAGTEGLSPALESLETSGKLSLSGIKGKREVFQLEIINDPFPDHPQIRELFVIAGSDKRGTIYGMFRLSELCGVSPLVYFGDAYPLKREDLEIKQDVPFISKEPSVRYRGFFINDEWPAFGNWCTERFGGINALAYRKIFELLLRLKGNYMWPAMWNSSFSEDGPGLENAELADKLGVVMGLSHHEPMCRAGVEWQRKYREYGEDPTWSFISNEEAITAFWRDGVIRNRPFENVITIGMRGENDSKLMPENATLSDNIEVIKKAIRAQHRLIKENVNEDLAKVPRMLAIYKEVEDYFEGDETCEGLKDWDEIKDVIFLLSDDNHGNLRGLPRDGGKDHPGGYGMYYHFDYHGAPISYEWTNCVRLTKTWEQMSQAYEAGVRDMWIVNVGDIKCVEYPLCFFMDLAFDYEHYGEKNPNVTERYLEDWIDRQFGECINAGQKDKLMRVIDGYTKWNAIRTPETMRDGIFDPVHFNECERVKEEVDSLLKTAFELKEELSGDALKAYESMVFYYAAASLNLISAYMDRGLNRLLAERGCIHSKIYADSMMEKLKRDPVLVEEFHRFNDGKWNHCLSSAHTGFRSWDDRDWTYPVAEIVTPVHGAKALISFRGSERFHLGAHWQDREPLVNDDLTRPDVDRILLDLDSRGDVSYSYRAVFESTWLSCDKCEGRVDTDTEGRATLYFTADRKNITGRKECPVRIEISFDNGMKTSSDLLIIAEDAGPGYGPEENVFIEKQGYCCIQAEHFRDKYDTDEGAFLVVRHLGREHSAIKAFPSMMTYPDPKSAPSVTYSFIAAESGTYELQLYMLSRNPAVIGTRLKFAVSVNGGVPADTFGVKEGYYTEWTDRDWSEGVLNSIRIVTVKLPVNSGRNDITIHAGEPGVIIEKLVLHPEGKPVPGSYLGPPESPHA